ncbi:hypothetical protein [Corynebacterium gerontici]|uniref:hypothetical protein n=1 Tax=Corynebacterium gerontici TaxID=2079234 RepID=UPI0013DE4EB3|nr:hypothetical protein [Corynebacterium gerontici]
MLSQILPLEGEPLRAFREAQRCFQRRLEATYRLAPYQHRNDRGFDIYRMCEGV